MAKRLNKWESRDIKYVSGTLEQFIQQLRDEFEEIVPEEYWKTATVNLDKEYDYGDSVTPIIQFTWSRPETDDEFNLRKSNEEIQLEYRRKQYEQLKKEFG